MNMDLNESSRLSSSLLLALQNIGQEKLSPPSDQMKASSLLPLKCEPSEVPPAANQPNHFETTQYETPETARYDTPETTRFDTNDTALFDASRYETRGKISVKLENREIIEKFNSLTTEMIITRVGRRMFPAPQITVSGLVADASYYVIMEIVPADEMRYRWLKNGWVCKVNQDRTHCPKLFVHPQQRKSGKDWMETPIDFSMVKLTNNFYEPNLHIPLHTMKKYQPLIHFVQANSEYEIPFTLFHTFAFEECRFIAVTAYQNPDITQLKIEKNPFAKGFRNSQGGVKRKSIGGVKKSKMIKTERVSPAENSVPFNQSRQDTTHFTSSVPPMDSIPSIADTIPPISYPSIYSSPVDSIPSIYSTPIDPYTPVFAPQANQDLSLEYNKSLDFSRWDTKLPDSAEGLIDQLTLPGTNTRRDLDTLFLSTQQYNFHDAINSLYSDGGKNKEQLHLPDYSKYFQT